MTLRGLVRANIKVILDNFGVCMDNGVCFSEGTG